MLSRSILLCRHCSHPLLVCYVSFSSCILFPSCSCHIVFAFCKMMNTVHIKPRSRTLSKMNYQGCAKSGQEPFLSLRQTTLGKRDMWIALSRTERPEPYGDNHIWHRAIDNACVGQSESEADHPLPDSNPHWEEAPTDRAVVNLNSLIKGESPTKFCNCVPRS